MIEIVQFILGIVIFFLFYFLLYPLSGAMELNDIPLLEQSLGMLIKNKTVLSKLLHGIEKYARISPLFGKFKSETLAEIRQRMEIKSNNLSNLF